LGEKLGCVLAEDAAEFRLAEATFFETLAVFHCVAAEWIVCSEEDL
jgi:hypothetical protein